MDFRNVNPLNVRLNMISGNLLPLDPGDASFPIAWRLYSVLMWLLQVAFVIGLIFGCIHVSKEKALKDGMICFAVFAEMFFVIARLHAYRDPVTRLVSRMNDILRVADDTMRHVVTTTVQPVQAPLRFYWTAGVISIITWSCIPMMLLFEKNIFYYEDYRIPVAFSGQPFSTGTFLLSSLVQFIGAVNLFLKKVGMDVYMVHMVLMTTAQYRYTAVKVMAIFRRRNELHGESREIGSSGSREMEMKVLCRHHNALIHITLLLKELLSLNCSVIYMNSVLRFCFVGIMLSTIPSTTIWEGISIVIYASGAVVQLYILCSCVQQLLDASTEVTDEAFHQEWYLSGSSFKSTFMLIIMANDLECNLAYFKNFNLSLPSFMMILNQSYSIALLFLRMK